MKTGALLLIVVNCVLFTGCSGCSQSGRRVGQKQEKRINTITSDPAPQVDQEEETIRSSGSITRSVVPIEREGGVDHIWVEVNNHRFRFIFDTGASNICISSLEATAMWKAGALSDDDVREIVQMQDATGSVSRATHIVLRTVKIGNMALHDVDALVINNIEAPLLFGQSALSQFGRFTVDNKNSVIILE